MTTDAYIVITTRTGGVWDHTVELHGNLVRLPGQVIDRIIAHRTAIVQDERKDRGRELAEIKAAKKAAETADDVVDSIEHWDLDDDTDEYAASAIPGVPPGS